MRGTSADRVAWLGWATATLLLGIASTLVLLVDRAPTPAWVAFAGFMVANVAVLCVNRPSRVIRTGYVMVAFAAAAPLLYLEPDAWPVLVLLVPQTFAFLEHTVSAVMACVLLLTVAVLLSPSSADDRVSIRDGILAVVGFGSTIAVGLFVKALLNEAHRRGELILALDAARAATATAERANGVAAERARLAREIHDTLAQGFTSLLFLVQAADASLDTDRDITRVRLALAAKTARENLDEARSLMAGDGPSALREHGLTEAVRRLALRLQETAGVSVVVAVTGAQRPLAPATQVIALRIVQECLANVRQHANAKSARVVVGFEPHDLEIKVRDDGVGFDATSPSSGVGIVGMRERVHSTGGTWSLDSTPGDGTLVRARVPG